MTNKIHVNIWDDYHDDGYVPDGEIQETYIYVEEDLSDDKCKSILELVQKTIQTIMKKEWKFEMSLVYYDSAKTYPNLVGTENEIHLFKQWQLEMKHLTHEVREDLVEILEKQNLSYMDKPIVVYSES